MRVDDREIERKTLQQSRIELVIKLEKKYIKTNLLKFTEDDFLQIKLVYLHFLVIWIHFACCLAH